MILVAVVCAVMAVYTGWVAAHLAWYGRRSQLWICRWQWTGLLSRRCPGARNVTGSVIYVHFLGPFVMYVGQTVNMANRMRGEARQTMALFFTHSLALSCPAPDLNRVEHNLIRAFKTDPLGFNRNEGHTMLDSTEPTNDPTLFTSTAIAPIVAVAAVFAVMAFLLLATR